jgi:hypothetical protein
LPEPEPEIWGMRPASVGDVKCAILGRWQSTADAEIPRIVALH